MRRIISILLLALMLLQVIPVLHFFFSHQEIFYTHIDEEKTEVSSKDNKESKEFISLSSFSPAEQTTRPHRFFSPDSHYVSPPLEFLTPPPDFS